MLSRTEMLWQVCIEKGELEIIVFFSLIHFCVSILVAVNPLENPDDPAGAPPNMAFLEILTEFTGKLLKQDKKVVLNYLDKRIAGGVPNSRGEDWAPLHMYRNSLVHGEADGAGAGLALPGAGAKRQYNKRQRRRSAEDDEDEDPDDPDYR